MFYVDSTVATVMGNQYILTQYRPVSWTVMLEWIRQCQTKKYTLNQSFVLGQSAAFHVESGPPADGEYSGLLKQTWAMAWFLLLENVWGAVVY
jgi:hypothetical protein